MENSFYRSFWAILGLIFGPILGQKSSRRLREANKATFQHSLKNLAWILLENNKIWLLGSFLGVLDISLGQFMSKNAKNVLDGLESQMRPFFYTIWRTEYEFCFRIWRITLKVLFWPFWALFLGLFWAKIVLEGLESQIRPLFYTVRGTYYEFCLKTWKMTLTGPSWPF